MTSQEILCGGGGREGEGEGGGGGGGCKTFCKMRTYFINGPFPWLRNRNVKTSVSSLVGRLLLLLSIECAKLRHTFQIAKIQTIALK